MTPTDIHKIDNKSLKDKWDGIAPNAKCHFCAEELDVQKFLLVNGPEVSYEFGEALKMAAMKDVDDSMREHYQMEREVNGE